MLAAVRNNSGSYLRNLEPYCSGECAGNGQSESPYDLVTMGQLPNGQPSFWITADGFNTFADRYGLCRVQDLNNVDAASVRPFLGDADNTVGVFASGYLPHQTSSDKIGGIDWIRQESNPSPKEKALNIEVNVYHYAVGRPIASGVNTGMYPVWECKKSSNQTTVPHWPEMELGAIIRTYLPEEGEDRE